MFYQIRHALQDAQDLWVTQPIVGKIKDAKFQALLQVPDVFRRLQVIVGYLERAQDWQTGWKARSAEVNNNGTKRFLAHKYTTLEPPHRESGGHNGIWKDPAWGVLTEVFNGLDVIVAEVQSIQFLQRF